jgi:hypothetical protein
MHARSKFRPSSYRFAWCLCAGIISTCQAAVSSKPAFFMLRLLLGLAEGAGPSTGETVRLL